VVLARLRAWVQAWPLRRSTSGLPAPVPTAVQDASSGRAGMRTCAQMAPFQRRMGVPRAAGSAAGAAGSCSWTASTILVVCRVSGGRACAGRAGVLPRVGGRGRALLVAVADAV